MLEYEKKIMLTEDEYFSIMMMCQYVKTQTQTNYYFDNDDLSSDDKEMLEDMLVIALNDAFKQVDKMTEQKMGKFTSMMPGGLF